MLELESSTPDAEARQALLSVTVLIPAEHLPRFRRRLQQPGLNPNRYFRFLLERATGSDGRSSRPGRVRVRALYQDRGLDLVRFHFRVEAAAWFELSLLARSAGESRCRFFWQLALLDCLEDYNKGQATGVQQRRAILWCVTLMERVSGRSRLAERRLEIRPPPDEYCN